MNRRPQGAQSPDRTDEPTPDDEPEESAAEVGSERPELEADEVSAREADATQLYLREIEASELLTPEQERDLARAAQQGDTEARRQMIESNLRLVVKVARRYVHRGLPLLDLVEEGNLGLIHAVEKFNPELGYRFSTYATWWIRQTIERGLMNQTRTIRLPIHVIKEINVYLRAMRRLRQKLEREPTAQEIAEVVDQPLDEVWRMLRLNERVSSLDVAVSSDSERPLVDVIADESIVDPAGILADEHIRGNCSEWIDELEPKQAAVVRHRFGLDGHERETLEAVGKRLGVTRERVRQIELDALRRLRDTLESRGYTVETLFHA